MKRPPRKGEGRPTSFTNKLGLEICKRIAQGETVRNICRDEKMPSAKSIYNWLLDEDKKEFLQQYNEAKNVQAELMFEELLEIADDGTNDFVKKEIADGVEVEQLNSEHIQRSRLRVDTRKWYLSKVLPKKYGDKLDMTSGGDKIQGNTIVLADFGDKDFDSNASDSK